MVRTVLGSLLLVFVTAATAPAAPDGPIVVDAARLWTGSGWKTEVRIVISDGRIVEMGSWDVVGMPAGARRIRIDGFVLPGLVLADSTGFHGRTQDERSITPGIRAADAYDPFRPDADLARSGVTVAYLSPGRERLVSGQGAVVRLGPVDPDAWLIRARAAVHGSVIEDARSPRDVFEPPVPSNPDDNPYRPARRQFPKVRGAAFLALRRLVERARRPDARTVPADGVSPDLRALEPLLDGEVPLRLRAHTAADILGAVRLARSLGVRLVVEGATEAWRVADDLAEADVSVVLPSGTVPGGKLPPPAPFRADDGRPHPEAAAILKRAGVTVALVPAAERPCEDFLWYAAQSLSEGFTRDDVLRAVTFDAARVLGVADRAGVVASGIPADLVAYDQDPLGPAARPVLVISGGEVRHEVGAGRDEEDDDPPLAIFAGTVYTCAGDPVKDGVVLVEDGKIVSVGRDVTIPAGARRVSFPGGCVVPGLIDSGGQVGIRGYETDAEGGVGSGPDLPLLPLDQPPAGFFDPGFPDVRATAASGVTTVVLSPKGSGRGISGVLSIVKTGGDPEDAVVAKEAGLLVDYASAPWSKSVVKGLRSKLETGRKYAERWTKYEKELAEWKKKNPDKEADRERKKLGKVTAPAARDPISGTWEGTAEVRGLNVSVSAELKLDGKKVTGVFRSTLIPEGGELDVEGTYEDARLVMELLVQGTTVSVDLEVGRDEMTGTWEAPEAGESGSVILKRTALPEGRKKEPAKEEKPGSGEEKKKEEEEDEGKKDGGDEKEKKKKKDEDAPPKKPKKVPALEPYRKLFGYEMAVHLAVNNERLGRELLELLREDFELTTVLLTTRLAPEIVSEIARLEVGFSPAGSVAFRSEGRWINPALMVVRRRVPVLLRSGVPGDPRSLYAAAAYAVRHGMDREDALRMVTRWPAIVFGLDGRVGTLRVGRDADLVVLSGKPFDPGSRVVEVMVDGRFVDEQE